MIPCTWTSNELVNNFNIKSAAFENHVDDVNSMGSHIFTEAEEKLNVLCQRTPWCPFGEVIPEVAMISVEEAPVSLNWKDKQTDLIKRAIPFSFYAGK